MPASSRTPASACRGANATVRGANASAFLVVFTSYTTLSFALLPQLAGSDAMYCAALDLHSVKALRFSSSQASPRPMCCVRCLTDDGDSAGGARDWYTAIR